MGRKESIVIDTLESFLQSIHPEITVENSKFLEFGDFRTKEFWHKCYRDPTSTIGHPDKAKGVDEADTLRLRLIR